MSADDAPLRGAWVPLPDEGHRADQQPSEATVVTVEFFGIPRQRTQTASVRLRFDHRPVEFRQVLKRLVDVFPAWGAACMAGDQLAAGLAANIDGARFVGSGPEWLTDGQTVLILSADAGG